MDDESLKLLASLKNPHRKDNEDFFIGMSEPEIGKYLDDRLLEDNEDEVFTDDEPEENVNAVEDESDAEDSFYDKMVEQETSQSGYFDEEDERIDMEKTA
jgi:hypothetical protein